MQILLNFSELNIFKICCEL